MLLDTHHHESLQARDRCLCLHPRDRRLAGCSASPDEEVGDDQGAIKGTDCKIFNNQTGKDITAAELALLNDPVAKKLLEGTCVNTYSEALKKMKTTDSKDLRKATAATTPRPASATS